MFYIILDGLVLLGLMYVFDRHNPYRDFLETGAVAFFLVVAELILSKLLQPLIGAGILVIYLGLCLVLLWRFVGMNIHKALVIGATFFIYKVGEEVAVRTLLVDAPAQRADQAPLDSTLLLADSFIRIAAGKTAESDAVPYVSYLIDGQRAYWNEAKRGSTAFHVPDIASDDVEKMEVLDPAAAQARFGTCPGVELIVITTKSRTWRPPTPVVAGPCPRIP
ncbi:MAG TPA: hypothetical protein VIW26_08915 [Gemmatimonadales bacterium]